MDDHSVVIDEYHRIERLLEDSLKLITTVLERLNRLVLDR